MRFLLLLILLAPLIINAQERKNSTLKGDLYFSDWRIDNLYHMPDTLARKFSQILDTIKIENHKNKEAILIYQKLKEAGLLYKPYVDIRIRKDSIVNLFLDSLDYASIKKYKRRPLLDEHKKVRIKALVVEIVPKGYYCIKLKKVKLVKGQTYRKGNVKYKIDDYY